MLKIKSFQKKILKISIMTFLVMISSILFTNSVSAFTRDDYRQLSLDTVEYFANQAFNDKDLVDNLMNNYYIYSSVFTFRSNGEPHRINVYFFPKATYKSVSYQGIRELNESITGVYWLQYYFAENAVYPGHVNESFGNMQLGFYTNSEAMPYGDPVSSYFNVEASFSKGFYLTDNDGFLDFTPTDNYNLSSSFKFNEDIDVTDISKIKINFELPEDTSNLEVDIKWSFDNLIGGWGAFSSPYIELIHSNGEVSLVQNLTDLYDSYFFEGEYVVTFLPDSDITTINLIADVYNAKNLMNVNFSSVFPYSISYEYINQVEDYFITIDMDDYASISLIPKVHNIETGVSSSISSPIYKYGTYDIEIWEDLETKKVIDRWDNHNNSYFVYPMYSGYKNTVIHFIKKEVDSSNKYIKFDTRYYSYVLKKYLNEEVTITNPNTNEDVIISDISDLYKYDSPVDNRFSFNSFLKPIKFVFESITNFYNNYCPEVVQYFFYIIFSFFIILVLIKIFL